jgi:hypothetical protein
MKIYLLQRPVKITTMAGCSAVKKIRKLEKLEMC